MIQFGTSSSNLWLLLLAVLYPLTSLFVSAAESGGTNKTERNVLVLGDSIAAGYGLDAEEGFPARLQRKIDDARLNFKVINAGLSGDTTAGGLRRMDWLLRQRVDVLLLELGGNDGLRGIGPETTRTNLQAIIDRTKAKYPKAEIVVAGMKMPANMGTEYREHFERVFAEVAEKNKATLIPFVLEGVGGRADLNQPDRIHPTAEGHRIIAETIWKYLHPVLNRTNN